VSKKKAPSKSERRLLARSQVMMWSL
jgi:hypothetical protein